MILQLMHKNELLYSTLLHYCLTLASWRALPNFRVVLSGTSNFKLVWFFKIRSIAVLLLLTALYLLLYACLFQPSSMLYCANDSRLWLLVWLIYFLTLLSNGLMQFVNTIILHIKKFKNLGSVLTVLLKCYGFCWW